MSESEFSTGVECAARLDENDPLGGFRSEFHIPKAVDGSESIYLVGNSLGALPRSAESYIVDELQRWGDLGVHGHHTGPLAWESYHELLTHQMAEIVGAHDEEVVVMNSLTVNLHLLMVTFYRPTSKRHKILIDQHAFPSDHFAVESQIRERGFDPVSSLVVVAPRPGENTIRNDDIVAAINEHGDELALVMFPGVHYYTGQVFDMERIAIAAHRVGANVGFDLAHAAGNVMVQLHDWDVDFATWCTYKYLNGGPGGVGGAFVNSRHVDDQTLPKLLGWWGTEKATRFEMATEFRAIPTVESWQLSNAPILAMAALRASLDLIDRAGGVAALRRKSELQVRYTDYLLAELLGDRVESITPTDLGARGCQFALRVVAPGIDGRAVFEQLEVAGVACDWRYPDVIRVAPVPLYNSFTDIHKFISILTEILQ